MISSQKKDRKKSKSVKKFATADELAKKLEDTKQQKSEVRPKKDRPVQEGVEPGRETEEEEWKDYEEPVKDYSGLKIQVLQGAGANQGQIAGDVIQEDSIQDCTKNSGPWNNKPAEEEVQVVAPPPVVTKSSVYIAPSGQRPEPLRRNQAKHAPDIHNDDNFPLLGASGNPRAGGWSTASSGGNAPGRVQRQPLTLGNRFKSLGDDS